MELVLAQFRTQVQLRKSDNKMYEEENVTYKNVFPIVRGRTNRQKHWFAQTGQRETIGTKNLGDGKWDDLLPTEQFMVLVYALGLLIDLY